DAHQLAVEVDEAFAFRRPKIDALGARDWNRIDSRLHGPFKESVFATEFDDLFARQVFSCGAHRPGCYSKSPSVATSVFPLPFLCLCAFAFAPLPLRLCAFAGNPLCCLLDTSSQKMSPAKAQR